MLGNFFRKSAGLKQRVNKKQNFEIYSPVSSRSQGKYTKC